MKLALINSAFPKKSHPNPRGMWTIPFIPRGTFLSPCRARASWLISVTNSFCLRGLCLSFKENDSEWLICIPENNTCIGHRLTSKCTWQMPALITHFKKKKKEKKKERRKAVGTQKATQNKGTRNRGRGLAIEKTSKMPMEVPHRIGIAAHLHTPQLEPVPVRIELCGPAWEQIIAISDRQACQIQKHAPS